MKGVKIAGEMSVVGKGWESSVGWFPKGGFGGCYLLTQQSLSPLADGREQNFDQSPSVKLNVFGGNH